VSTYEETCAAFVEMAHRIVWCSAATVDAEGRPRSRILHPIWEWDGATLVGWIATSPTATKRAHLDHSPNISLSYWAPNHDTCTSECVAEWVQDDDGRSRIWDLFKNGPAPVGYDPAMIPAWKEGPLSSRFMPLRLAPWRLRVFPGTVLMGQGGAVLTWQS
jgi:hypothetical protein